VEASPELLPSHDRELIECRPSCCTS
jgi:hypothetical protein